MPEDVDLQGIGFFTSQYVQGQHCGGGGGGGECLGGVGDVGAGGAGGAAPEDGGIAIAAGSIERRAIFWR